jgi:hypothetical protein
MDKLLEKFFKQKLSITAGDELPSKYVDKIILLQNSIVVPEVFTENIAEQLDAVLEEFGINIKAASFEEIKTSCNILKSFGFKISENNEDTLIEKLELITAITKWHGFSSISKISESKLSNLKTVYDALTEEELSNINYDVFNKVRKINLAPIKQLAKLDVEELHKFLEFCKSYGISTNLEIADLTKTSRFNEILGILRIDNNWLEDSNQKKLATLFKASGIVKIADIKLAYAKSLSVIKKEFNFDFSKLSQFKLKSKIAQLTGLNLTFTSTAEEIESAAHFVSEFCTIEDLNSYDAAKIAKIMEALGTCRRDKKETSQVIQLMKSFGIKFSLSEDLDNQLVKIQKLSTILKNILNKEIADLSFSEIKEVIKLYETFAKNKIITASDKDIEAIKKILQLFPVAKEAKEFDAKKLQQIFSTLKIEPKEINKLENLSSNLKKLNLDIWSMDRSEIQKAQELLEYLDSSLATEVITDVKKEKFSKIKEFLGADYHNRDIEKINRLASVIGKAKISDLEVEEISRLKLITIELGIDIRDTHISEIEYVVAILSAYDIKSVVKNQSTLSKIWSGEVQALKDKLSQIKEIFKNLGYDSLTELKGEEKVKFKNILELYQKASFEDFTKDVSENINKFLNNLDLSFRELSSYKLQRIMEGFKQIGINLFESKDDLEKYGYFLKEINLDLEKLNESIGSKINETLDLFRVDRANIKEEVEIINDTAAKLHLPEFSEIKKDHIEKIKELGEAIAGEVIELTPKVTSSIAKILHWYKIAFEMPTSTNVEYHKPDEKGLVDKIKKLQVFKIDLKNEESVLKKDNMLMHMSHIYKTNCHNDQSEQVNYDKEFSAIMQNSNEKLAQFVEAAENKVECIKFIDHEVSDECKGYFDELNLQIKGLCPVSHEDL